MLHYQRWINVVPNFQRGVKSIRLNFIDNILHAWGKVYSTELHRQYSSCLAPVTIGAQMRGLAMLRHQRWINVVAFFSEPLPMSPARQKEELRKSKCQPFSSC